ncbi:hypothetical protein PPERSA_04598 [Pseudocohnilembus persalinus]|uniref:Uncharacterized protein n=1 Tax=Pseudocohnilembus persalinus TaxID=266149 RepID=A0A0V0QNE2_PSEPJ|nr:hypothetical protein PPERSA_04598 [Pseudocohnilembus persalinus]|eukprot:KRX03803.1 hypothetical protein PPERSA_04598 [Pseudocohnilembus persalinus]
MSCKKCGHYNSPYIFLKMTEDISQIFQCMYCVAKDTDQNKKIVIEELLKNKPIWEINNFPPSVSENQEFTIKNVIRNYKQENIDKYQEEVKNKIIDIFDSIEQSFSKVLNQQKKDILIKFEDFFKYTDLNGIYDISNLRQSLEQFQKGQIDINKFFEVHIKFKEQLYDKEIRDKSFNHTKIRQEIFDKVEVLKQKLEENINSISQNLEIESELVNSVKNSYKSFEFKNSSHVSVVNKSEDLNYIKQIIFYPNSSPQKYQYAYIQNDLQKDKRYNLRLKINQNNNNIQELFFVLQGQTDLYQEKWLKQNIILLKKHSFFFQQDNSFLGLIKDDQTVINIVFNCQERLFEIYDDQRKKYERNVVDINKIKGDLVFVIGTKQLQNFNNNSNINVTVLDINEF